MSPRSRPHMSRPHMSRRLRVLGRVVALAALAAVLLGPGALARADQGLPDPANWMAALAPRIGQLNLTQVVLPATHDSGTSTISATPPPGIPSQDPFAPDDMGSAFGSMVLGTLNLLFQNLGATIFVPWTRAQDTDVATQLNNGIRYLDLRLCGGLFSDSAVYICHGLYGGEVGASVLQPVADFVHAHPTEIVVLDIHALHSYDGNGNAQSDLTPAQNAQLVSQIHAILGNLLLTTSMASTSTSLNDIWQTSGRVIVLDPDQTVDQQNGFWCNSDSSCGSSQVNIAWPNTDDVSTLETTVDNNWACRCDTTNSGYGSPNQIFDLQLQATPSTSTIVNGILDPLNNNIPHSLAELASETNTPVFNNLLSTFFAHTQQRPSLNVISADGFEATPLAAMAVALNSAPFSTLTIGAPTAPMSGTTWPVVTSATSLTLALADRTDTSGPTWQHICLTVVLVCPFPPGPGTLYYRVYPQGTPPPTNFTTTQNATASLTLGPQDGAYEIDYYAIDNLGTREPTHTLIVYRDNNGLRSTLNIGQPQYPLGGTAPVLVNSTTPITLSIVAPATGTTPPTGDLSYRIFPSGQTPPPYTIVTGKPMTTFRVQFPADDLYEIDSMVADPLGRTEHPQQQMVYLDNHGPQPALIIGAPQYQPQGSPQLFITQATTLALKATNPNDPIASISYRFYPKGSTQPPFTVVQGSSAQFHLTGADGQYEVDYYATDRLGMQQQVQRQFVTLDDTGPAVTVTQPAPTMYENNGMLTFAYTATDGQGAGVSNMTATLDGSSTVNGQTIQPGLTISLTDLASNDPHFFTVSAVDQLGNTSSTTLLFSVASAPVLTASRGSAVPFQSIVVTGTGYGFPDTVTLSLDGATPLTQTTTQLDGSFVTRVTVPQASYGAHTIVGIDSQFGFSSTTTLHVTPWLYAHSTPAGQRVTLYGFGFGANEMVKVYWGSGSSVNIASAQSNGVGTVALSITPTTPGTYYLYGAGQTTKAVGKGVFKVT